MWTASYPLKSTVLIKRPGDADELHGRAGREQGFLRPSLLGKSMVIVFVKFISSIAGGRLYSGWQMSGQARNYEQDNLDTYHLPYYYKGRS